MDRQESAAREQTQAIHGDHRPLAFSVGWLSLTGPIRERNEDAMLCVQALVGAASDSLAFGLFVLADGLGGQAEGERASELAVRTFAGRLLRSIAAPLVEGHALNTLTEPIQDSLLDAADWAGEAIRRETREAASTLTAALVLSNRIYIAHLGDSRAYLISGGTALQLTHDHSLVARLIELGQIMATEAADHPQRNLLYAALGHASTMAPEITFRGVEPGDSLLLCSDGLWGAVSSEDLIATVESTPDVQRACEALVELAICNGSQDNVSAILLRWPG